MLSGIAAVALARRAAGRAPRRLGAAAASAAMKFSSSSPSVAAVAVAAASVPSASMAAATSTAALRASALLPRRSPSLAAWEGRSSWSFGSSHLMRGVCVHSLSRDDDERRARPKIANAATMTPCGARRGAANDDCRRRNLHLHARAFSANLPGESPARDAQEAVGVGAVGPLGFRRDDEGDGAARAPPPPPPPPPPPLAGARAASPLPFSDPSPHSPHASSSSSSSSSSSPHSRADSAALARELHTVSVAIAANAAIFAAKACAYAATGSSAMLAECVHSVVDTANQALLRLGVVRSRRPPTALHPYGFMKDKFVWSLVSAVGIFCMGAGATVAHGVSALMDALAASSAMAAGGAAAAAAAAAAPEVTNLGVSAAVLTVSAVVESYSLLVATRAVAAGAAAAGLSFSEYVRRGSDPTSVAVMLEDGAAVAGLAIAGLATAATAATGNVAWDAAGSLAVGALLGATAVFLIQQNRSLLIGRAMNSTDMQRVLNHLARDPAVQRVYDAKSEEIGPGVYRFKAEIEFDGDVVVRRARERSCLAGGARSPAARVRAAVMLPPNGGGSGSGELDSSSSAFAGRDDVDFDGGGANWDANLDARLDAALDDYGKELVGALGSEIDRIEASIRAFMPSIRHIDLEADKGSAGEVRHSLRDPS